MLTSILCLIGIILYCQARETYNTNNLKKERQLSSDSNVEHLTEEDLARIWLKEIDTKLAYLNIDDTKAQWNYASNLTDYNNEIMINSSVTVAYFKKEFWKNISNFDWKNFNDSKVYRQFQKCSNILESALPDDKVREFQTLVSNMQTIFATGKVCQHNETKPNCSMSLEPDLTRILSKSIDYDELLYVWKEWHDTVGPPMRKSFEKYVELSNEAAHILNFTDMGAGWRDEFENDTFENIIEHLFSQVLPLYEQLHAYVRKKLINMYGEDKVDPNGPIPAHLLGNMWAQTWGDIYEETMPFPKKKKVDVTANLIKQGYTPLKMFKTAEEFFTSLGLLPMTDIFWEKSIMEKPEDREIICHASAWDFFDGKDFRIKMCTDVTSDELVTIHHEMGHIQYYMQYKIQPQLLRDGANSGFHEAIGDTMALSACTPKHLHKIGLLEEEKEDKERDINFLYQMALNKLAFLPFGYLIDQWRWKVFAGEITPENYNKKWWDLRFKYQGIAPAITRNEKHFDPGTKYHIAANVPYVRYFVSFIVQFQFHKALCQAAGHQGPLHSCDIYQSKEAGKLLSDVLKLGASEPWPIAMAKMTGQPEMDASAIMNYFEPLMAWLKEENKNEKIGWGYDWSSKGQTAKPSIKKQYNTRSKYSHERRTTIKPSKENH